MRRRRSPMRPRPSLTDGELATFDPAEVDVAACPPMYKSEGEALFNMGYDDGFAGGAYSCGRCHTKGWSYGEKAADGTGAFGPALTNVAASVPGRLTRPEGSDRLRLHGLRPGNPLRPDGSGNRAHAGLLHHPWLQDQPRERRGRHRALGGRHPSTTAPCSPRSRSAPSWSTNGALLVISLLAALSWDPGFRGLLTVVVAVAILCGSVFLILATNTGARLGFLLALTGFCGWMFVMGIIWSLYGIGWKGDSPTWKVVDVVRSEPGSGEVSSGLEAADIPTPARRDSPTRSTPRRRRCVPRRLPRRAARSHPRRPRHGRGPGAALQEQINEQVAPWRILETSNKYTGETQAVVAAALGPERPGRLRIGLGLPWSSSHSSPAASRAGPTTASLGRISYKVTSTAQRASARPFYAAIQLQEVIPQETKPGQAPPAPVRNEDSDDRHRRLEARRRPPPASAPDGDDLPHGRHHRRALLHAPPSRQARRGTARRGGGSQLTVGQYLPIVVMLVLGVTFAGVSLVMSKLVSPKRPSASKAAPYECGIVPRQEPPERFPVRFYLVAMIFIVVDIEIIFLYPYVIIHGRARHVRAGRDARVRPAGVRLVRLPHRQRRPRLGPAPAAPPGPTLP